MPQSSDGDLLLAKLAATDVGVPTTRGIMWVTILEVALVVLIGVVLLAPSVRTALRRARPTAPVQDEPGQQESGKVRWARRIGATLFAVAIVNFLAYSVHTRNLGGSADNFKQDEGRYFVSSHGRYTEVSEKEWRRVQAHGIAVYVTHGLGLLVGAPLIAYAQGWRLRGPAHSDTPGAAHVQASRDV